MGSLSFTALRRRLVLHAYLLNNVLALRSDNRFERHAGSVAANPPGAKDRSGSLKGHSEVNWRMTGFGAYARAPDVCGTRIADDR
jgi:hypothetical protein